MIYDYHTHDYGSIEVICGPMFSGKTEELIRRIRRVEQARIALQVFKPAIDNRYADDDLVSHNQLSHKGKAVVDTADLRKQLDPFTQVIAIDEIQFFDNDIIELLQQLAEDGLRVISAGLDLDYLSEPFPIVSSLMAQAEHVTKLTAICVQCGRPASRSFRLSNLPQQVLIGGGNLYEARCRHCFFRDFTPSTHR